MAKYDIQTLMRMKQNAHIDPSRFSDQARGNNLLRDHDAGVLSERSVNKPRVISNTSRRSEGVASSIGSRAHGPPRRPNKSSQRDLEHADAGFVRFLKTHTSPRHQRVTAGGRIVPMESEGPPPKMNLPSAQQGAKLSGSRSWRAPAKRGNKNRLETKSTQSMGPEPTDSGTSPKPPLMSEQNRASFVDGDHDRQGSSYGYAPSISSAFNPGAVWQSGLPSPLVNVPVEQLYAPSQMPTLPIYPMYTIDPGKITWVPTVYQTGNAQGFPVGSLPRPPQHGSPISMLPDNHAWSNVNNAPPPSYSQCVPGYDALYPTVNPQWQQFAHDPILPQGHLPHTPVPLPTHNSLDHADKAYENLSAELSRIDRYMALHTWDISSDRKASMVEQRRKLVRELDAVRMYKEHLELIAGKSTLKDSGAHQNATRSLPTPPEPHTPMHSDGHPGALGSMPSRPTSLQTSRPSLRPSLANQFPSFSPVGGRHEAVSGSKPVRSPYLSRHNAAPEDTPASRLALRRFESSSGGPEDGETRGTLVRESHSHNPKGITGATGDGGRWAVSANPLERKLRRLYHKIQTATRRGEPSKNLLKQLSDVTGQLLKEGSEESNPESQTSVPDQQLLVTRFGTQSDVTPGISDGIESSSPVEHNPNKPWKSEAHARDLGVGAQQPTPFWVDTSDSKTLSSGSTTDSWASVGESDKHLFTRSTCQKSDAKDSQDLYKSCSSSSAGKGVATAGTARGGISNLDGEASTPNPKRNHPPLLTQCLSRHRGSVLQKTAAVTAPQSINVHALMPQMDGPGDSLDCGRIISRDADNRTGTVLDTEARRGYLPRNGISPSLADIQELFHRIAGDDREQVAGVDASAQEPLEAFKADAIRFNLI